MDTYLVGGLEQFLFFHMGKIIRIDNHIFVRVVQTTNQLWILMGGISCYIISQLMGMNVWTVFIGEGTLSVLHYEYWRSTPLRIY